MEVPRSVAMENAETYPIGQAPEAAMRTYMRKKQWGRHISLALLLGPGVVLLSSLFFYPLFHTLELSFRNTYPGAFSYTLEHYVRVTTSPYFAKVAVTTFSLALTVTAICAVLGYPVALFLARSRSRLRPYVFLGVVAPLLVNVVARTVGWTIVLGSEGLINSLLQLFGFEQLQLMSSFWSVVVGMVHVLLPFMILSISSVLQQIDVALEETAELLGASPTKVFLLVTLPLSIHGVVAGSVIVFCLTIGAYVTPFWLSNGKVLTFSSTIYQQALVVGDLPLASAAAFVLVFAALIFVTLLSKIATRYGHRSSR